MAKISYLVPVPSLAHTVAEYSDHVHRTLRSIVNQTVPFWELIICVPRNRVADVTAMISALRTASIAEKIQVLAVASRNQAIGLNQAAQAARGQWLAVVEPANVLAQHATYNLLVAIGNSRGANLIYADQDFLDPEGVRFSPYFRSDFSPDLLYSQNYIGSFFAIRNTTFRSLAGFNTGFGLAWSHDLILRLTERVLQRHAAARRSPISSVRLKRSDTHAVRKAIVHTPGVIYHQRVHAIHSEATGSAPLCPEDVQARVDAQSIAALKAHFSRSARKVTVDLVSPGIYRHHWAIPRPVPLVTIIIPTRNGFGILKACVESIISKTNYANYEIIIVDNQSTEARTIKYLTALKKSHKNIQVIQHDDAFNFSAINNQAVRGARGEILAFVNNDIEVITPGWLAEMVGHAVRPDVGCVGAMHFYPDGTIQHAGVIVGMNGVADHSFKCKDMADPGADYHGYLRSIRDTDAVTAATLVMRRDLFERIGGFDEEHLAVAFNDVDLCLRLKQAGYRIVWTPFAELLHHESKTRASDRSDAARRREHKEHAVMKTRWKTHEVEKKGLLHSHSIGL